VSGEQVGINSEFGESHGLTRRDLLAGAAGIGLSLSGASLLAACGGSSKTHAGAPNGALAALPEGNPVRGGTFTVGTISGGQAENLFPGTAALTPDYVRDYTLYNLLFYLGKEITPLVPGLALSAEPNKDATLWTFKLRDGVHWHDGKPFGADDVVYNFKALWSTETANFAAGFLAGLVDFKNVRKRDRLTVEVPLHVPVAEFPTIFAYYTFPVVQAGATPKSAAQHPIGTGPFKYVSFTPGSQSVFEANRDYWEPGKPYVDRLVVDSSFTDTNALFNALLSGKINLYPTLPLVTARQQIASKQVQILASTFAAESYMFSMRVDKGPFADNRVRQAFKLLVDRQAMINGSWAGFGTVGHDLLAPGTAHYAADLKRSQDVEKAKSLFKEAGVLGHTFVLPTCNFLPARGGPALRLADDGLPVRVHALGALSGHALGSPARRGGGGEADLRSDRRRRSRQGTGTLARGAASAVQRRRLPRVGPPALRRRRRQQRPRALGGGGLQLLQLAPSGWLAGMSFPKAPDPQRR
jgi:peptide/nickel transport system substrate-binding protein